MNLQNKQSFIAFSSFLKRLVQAFQYLGFTADLQSTTLMKKAKEKTPHHLVLKWTEHCPSSNLRQSESRKQSNNHQFSSLKICQLEQPTNQAIQKQPPIVSQQRISGKQKKTLELCASAKTAVNFTKRPE